MAADGARSSSSEAWIAHAVTGALSGALWIGVVGLAFALASVWMSASPALSALPLLVALAQLWLLLRVAIDRRLFDALAASADPNVQTGQADLAGLDGALTGLGWIASERTGRPLPERARGAMRLVRASLVLAAVQLCLSLLILLLR
ncbi:MULTISPECIES: hypothetical protein [unclassified Cupriavidus]|uniref:hypothetical protein n=1 Tax=unclassified Cupriavidus TaxID=2640874 RepID=UPI00040F72EC|nr:MULTISPECIES: hypothetical protein [unclassified Cupriavidus]MBP0630899.1 hypothetical protein [Cupriavidus sp. AcVe19-1a]MBP0634180.1 hypothetical protein [Cupriavidus sp. AcVe19-6a]